MNPFFKVITKYKIATIAYIVYLLIWWSFLETDRNYHRALSQIDAGEKVAWGEGVTYGDLLILAIGAGTTLVCLGNAVFLKKRKDVLSNYKRANNSPCCHILKCD